MNYNMIQLLYCLKSGNTYIFEIKYLDVPTTEPKSKRFQWFLSKDNHKIIKKLTIESITNEGHRHFKEGYQLQIDRLQLIDMQPIDQITQLVECNETEKSQIIELVRQLRDQMN